MNKIYKIVENENLNIIPAKLENANAYIVGNYIAVDENIIKKGGIKEKMTVAEEVAHYKVGVTPTLPFADDYYTKLIRSKNEFKAFKWMQSNLIPDDIEKFKFDTIWEIADRFDVSPEFIKKVLEYRKEVDTKYFSM